MNLIVDLRQWQSMFGAVKTGFSFTNFLCAAVLLINLSLESGQAAGTVVAWGANEASQSTIPNHPVPKNIAAVDGGAAHSLALVTNGVIVGWGGNALGETTSPSNMTNAVAIAAGNGFSLALRSSGTVVVWGSQSIVPAGLTNAVAIAASLDNLLALKKDGSVVSWGVVPPPPATVTNVVAIGAGNQHSLALEGDGTVVAWGDDTRGQSTVPAGLSNVIAIAAGARHGLALKQNGTVVVWGDNAYSQLNVPGGLANVVGIGAGRYHNLAIVGDGSPVITVQPVSQYNASTGDAFFCVMAAGLAPLSYQWQQDGTNIVGATNSLLVLTNLSTSVAGTYSVTVSNSLGTVTSANVQLPPVWHRPFFLVQPQAKTVVCGDPATFQAVANGSTPLSYQWQLAGTNVSGATNFVLSLVGVSGSDAGP